MFSLSNISKKLKYFNFVINVNSSLSDRIFVLFFVIDLIILIMLPIDKVLHFAPFNQTGEMEQNLNIFLSFFAEHKSFDIITDVINGLLAFFLILIIATFFYTSHNHDGNSQTYLINQVKDKYVQSFSIILLVLGRYISSIFFGVQALAFRCFSQPERCASNITLVRLLTNLFGLAINLMIVYIQFKYQYKILPEKQAPWARTKTHHYFIVRSTLFLTVLILTFEDTILESLPFYVIQMPTFFLTTLSLTLVIRNNVYFNRPADFAALLKCLISWNFNFFGLVADILISYSDFSFAILLAFSIFLMSSAAILFKYQNLYDVNDINDMKNTSKSQQTLLKLYHLVGSGNQDQRSKMVLGELFQFHTLNCENQECFCQRSVQKAMQDKLMKSYEFQKKNQWQGTQNGQLDTQFDIKGKNFNRLEMRNYILMLIYFKKLSKSGDSSLLLKYFEIYVKVHKYDHIYQGMYQLLDVAKKQNKNQETITFKYLKALIQDKCEKITRKNEKDYVNIDKILSLDRMFLTYKKAVYETTLQLEQFWSSLLKPDYSVKNVMDIGVKIVDDYLETKQAFDFMILGKPDFEEAVVIHCKFLEKVMNFDVEASIFQNLLGNIRQKLQISKQAHYISDTEKYPFVITQYQAQQSPKILYVNDAFCKQFGYFKDKIQGQQMNLLIPSYLQNVHDQMLDNFLQTFNQQQLMSKILKRVWLVNRDQSISIGNLQVQFKVCKDNDLVMISSFQSNNEVHSELVNYNLQNIFCILTDETGIVFKATKNFVAAFLDEQFFSFTDSRVFIDDITPSANLIQEQEFIDGKRTNMFEKIQTSQIKSPLQSCKMLPIILFRNIYELSSSIKIHEYIIVPEFDLKDRKMREFKSLLYESMEEQAQDEDAIEVEGDGARIDSQLQEYLNEISASQSASASSSSTSGVLLQKQLVDEKQVPKSLQNLNKAIIIFFLILIGTSFSVLAVNQIQNTAFSEDSLIVTNSISISDNLNKMRLCFRMMVSVSKLNDSQKIIDVPFLQSQVDYYFNILQGNLKDVILDKNYQTQELRDTMQQPLIRIQELLDQRVIRVLNQTYGIVLQTYLSKSQKFITMNPNSFIDEFKAFRLRSLPVQPSQNQKDAFYVMINGMYDIRSYSLLISDLFVEQSQQKSQYYQNLVMIIVIVCIAVNTITAFAVIPVTFSLDNESQNIVEQWMRIDYKTRNQTLISITQFLDEWSEQEKNKDKDIDHKMNSKKIDVEQYEMSNEDYYQAEGMSISIKNFNIMNAKSVIFQRIGSKRDVFNSKVLASLSPQKNVTQSSGGNQVGSAPQTINPPETQDIVIPSSARRISKVGVALSQEFAAPYKEVKHQTFQGPAYYNLSHNSITSPFQTVTSKMSQEDKDSSHAYQDMKSQQNIMNSSINLDTSQDNLNIQAQSLEYEEARRKEINKIFRFEKCIKISLILGFSLTILAFYLSFLFISQTISDANKDSYVYIRNYFRRPTCLANSFNFMLETFSQNKTIFIGFDNQTAFDFMQNTCMGYEETTLDYRKNSPPQLKEILDDINQLSSSQMCNMVFGNQSDVSKGCMTINNGIFTTGLRNTMLSLYYFINQEYVSFYSFEEKPWLRTADFLAQHEFSKTTQTNVFLLIKYLMPIHTYLGNLVLNSLHNYLSSLLRIYIGIFVLFLVFLIFSMIICLQVVVSRLKIIVVRSKILIKIIPTEALKAIQREEVHQKTHHEFERYRTKLQSKHYNEDKQHNKKLQQKDQRDKKIK